MWCQGQPVVDIVFINALFEGRVCQDNCELFFSAILVGSMSVGSIEEP
ncbi:hypothetical protein [Methanosarcina sp. DH2]|nr:hypothetical protein [Methanosarcina sp. DH2]